VARKAKRRGRPFGSKNKKTLGKSVATMDIAKLVAHIDPLQNLRVHEQQSYFETQLVELMAYTAKKAPAAYHAVGLGEGRKRKRAKAAPKYQSKKHRTVNWSGRGTTPVWLRAEMEEMKLKKEDFLIKA